MTEEELRDTIFDIIKLTVTPSSSLEPAGVAGIATAFIMHAVQAFNNGRQP